MFPIARGDEVLRRLFGRGRALRADIAALVAVASTEGLAGAYASAKLVRSRRRLSDPPLPPDSPLGWRGTVQAIRRHYALDVTENITWSETEARRDVRRIIETAGQSDQSKWSSASIRISGADQLRQALATVEAIRSWPESRNATIDVHADDVNGEPWSVLDAVPGVSVVGEGAKARDARDIGDTITISAGTLPPPDWLQRQQAEEASGDSSTNRQKILVVTKLVPDIRRGSGSLDVYWFARHSVELGYDVLLVATSPRVNDSGARWDLRRAGVLVASGCLSESRIAAALPRAVAESHVVVAFDTGMVQRARRWIEGATGDQRLLFMPLDLRQFPLRALLAANQESELPVFGFPAPTDEDLAALISEELEAIQASDLTALISLQEMAELRDSEIAEKLFHLPMLRSHADWVAQSHEYPRLVFVGGFRHPPNYLAVNWFVHEIWPTVRKSCTEACFEIFGADLSQEWANAWGRVPGVRVVGAYEADDEPYRGDVISVAPLTYGGGTKGKVVSAIGHGAVVVGTSYAAQGLPEDIQRCVIVADGADELAASLIRVIGDSAQRERIRADGRDAYSRTFAPEVGAEYVRACLDMLQANRMGPSKGVERI